MQPTGSNLEGLNHGVMWESQVVHRGANFVSTHSRPAGRAGLGRADASTKEGVHW